MGSPVPLIGITTADRDEELVSSIWYEASYSVPAHYVDAIRRAGGNPILLPPGEPDWAHWLDVLDGVVVTGGSDVAASHYGGDPSHPQQQRPQVDRDATELALTRWLIAGTIPALFVCRGLQLLNVVAGGSLHQHLADTLERDMHRLDTDGWAYHDAELKAGSLVAKATGTETVTGASGHHQAIDRLGDGIQAVGWAADGIIEAVELAGPTWLVGVQWHPEVTADGDAAQQGLFDALVEAARASATIR